MDGRTRTSEATCVRYIHDDRVQDDAATSLKTDRNLVRVVVRESCMVAEQPCRNGCNFIMTMIGDFSFPFPSADRDATEVLSDVAQPRLHVGGSELTTSEQRTRTCHE